MWTFTTPSMLLLAFALSGLLIAHLTRLRATSPARWLSLFVTLAPPVYVLYRIVTPPGPSGLFHAIYGAYVGLGAAALIAAGANVHSQFVYKPADSRSAG
jgi:hypothetical protein